MSSSPSRWWWCCTTGISEYETVKCVKIRDSRLGVIRLLTLAAIALYVGGYEMYMKGGYLDSSPVVGSIRFSLQQPTEPDNCDPLDDNSNDGADCENAFAPLDELDYCQQAAARMKNSSNSNSSNSSYRGQVYPCEIYEAVNAQIVSEKSLVVLTRASARDQTLVCDGSGDGQLTCPRTYRDDDDNEHRKFYVAQSEAFTVMLEHAVAAPKMCDDATAAASASSGGRNHNYACSAEAYR